MGKKWNDFHQIAVFCDRLSSCLEVLQCGPGLVAGSGGVAGSGSGSVGSCAGQGDGLEAHSGLPLITGGETVGSEEDNDIAAGSAAGEGHICDHLFHIEIKAANLADGGHTCQLGADRSTIAGEFFCGNHIDIGRGAADCVIMNTEVHSVGAGGDAVQLDSGEAGAALMLPANALGVAADKCFNAKG